MKRLIIIFVPFILLQSCSDKSSVIDPTYFMDGFKGITFTSEESPDILGGDLTDWCYSNVNPNWKLKSDSVEVDIPGIKGFEFNPCYPNPANVNGYTNLTFALPVTQNIKIYMINKHNTILAILLDAELAAGRHLIRCDLTGLPPDVYRFIAETEHHFCKGDLLIR